jgi:hypothetical protein
MGEVAARRGCIRMLVSSNSLEVSNQKLKLIASRCRITSSASPVGEITPG